MSYHWPKDMFANHKNLVHKQGKTENQASYKMDLIMGLELLQISIELVHNRQNEFKSDSSPTEFYFKEKKSSYMFHKDITTLA